jgi:hypothetical protein
MRVAEHWHKIGCLAMKMCAIDHGRPKTVLPVSVAKTWVADGRHEIIVRQRKHVSREAKNCLTGLRGPKHLLWFGHQNSTMCKITMVSRLNFCCAMVLITCSQMLWIKNKATQMLIITDLHLSKHYLHMGIMLIRRRSRRTYLHHLIYE